MRADHLKLEFYGLRSTTFNAQLWLYDTQQNNHFQQEILVSIGCIVMVLELPPLNINTGRYTKCRILLHKFRNFAPFLTDMSPTSGRVITCINHRMMSRVLLLKKFWFHTTYLHSNQIYSIEVLRQIMGKLKYPTLGHQTSMYQFGSINLALFVRQIWTKNLAWTPLPLIK